MIRLGKSGNYAGFIANQSKENVDANVQKCKMLQRASKDCKKSCMNRNMPDVAIAHHSGRQSTALHGQMLKMQYSQQISYTYSASILQHICGKQLPLTNVLDNHTISTSLRAKMVDWIIQVLSSYKMSEQSFFKSVSLMDSYLQKQPQCLETKDIHLIGVACMFTAMKYEQIHPLRLSLIVDKIARKKFTRKQIVDKQSRILELLEFGLEFPTVFEIVQHINYEIKLGLSSSICRYLLQILTYLSKMCMFNSELAAKDLKVLASAIYFIGLKTLEQVASSISPEEVLHRICDLMCIQQERVMQTSRKVLDLAKNFSKAYPNLGNLKLFNSFQYHP